MRDRTVSRHWQHLVSIEKASPVAVSKGRKQMGAMLDDIGASYQQCHPDGKRNQTERLPGDDRQSVECEKSESRRPEYVPRQGERNDSNHRGNCCNLP